MSEEREAIAIFGSGDAGPESEEYLRARALGERVVRAGFPVVTGGYGGVMEGASRGAREAGGEAIGITCRLFSARDPNRWLTLEIEEPDLMARTDRLFRLARGVVVLGGCAGTLGELGMGWALLRARALACPVVLWDDVWTRIYRELLAEGRLDATVRRWTHTAGSLDEAVACLAATERNGERS